MSQRPGLPPRQSNDLSPITRPRWDWAWLDWWGTPFVWIVIINTMTWFAGNNRASHLIDADRCVAAGASDPYFGVSVWYDCPAEPIAATLLARGLSLLVIVWAWRRRDAPIVALTAMLLASATFAAPQITLRQDESIRVTRSWFVGTTHAGDPGWVILLSVGALMLAGAIALLLRWATPSSGDAGPPA